MKIIKRQVPLATDLKVRAMGDGNDSRIIEGYCLKFGVRSRLLCDWYDLYYEVLEPGSVTREMLDAQDIKLTIYHNREKVLARSKEGAGTLNYDVDSVGVKFWAEMPQTAWGDEALELVKRGDISGCSFIYSTNEQDATAVQYENIIEDGESVLLRHVLRIDNVYDFTITTDPAYEQTNVTRREVEDAGVILKPAEDIDPASAEGEEEGDEESTDPEESKEEECTIDLAAKRELLRSLRKSVRKSII